MGSRSDYDCKKCGKHWVDDLQLFYLMSDNQIEYSRDNMLTPFIARCSVAKGYVSETYCKYCDKDIKLYLITEVKTEYPNQYTNKIIEEYKRDPNKIFGTSDELKEGTKISCHKCNNEINLHYNHPADDEFDLNCNTYKAYCHNCCEHYTFYAIKPPLRDYTKIEAIEKNNRIN